MAVALLFGCKFLTHRGEFVLGLGLGIVLQIEMGLWDCVTPTIVTHAIVLIVRSEPQSAFYNSLMHTQCGNESRSYRSRSAEM